MSNRYRLSFTLSDGSQIPAGEIEVPPGSRGTSILNVTTAPSSYTTTTDGFTPKYRIALSTVKTQSGATSVIVGDTLRYSYYVYPVGHVTSSYVYCGTRVSIRGATGATGPSGTTPVKGTDFFTEDDIEEIVSRTVIKLKDGGVVGYVDSDNNIILSGSLGDGSYSVKYEMEDGSTVDVGGLVLGEVEEVINQITISTDASGNPFNGGQGWKTGYRLSNSGGGESALDGYEVTGFIPCTQDHVIRIKNIGLTNENNTNIVCYDSNKQPISISGTNKGTSLYQVFVADGTNEGNGVYASKLTNTDFLTNLSSVAYIRIGSTEITDASIVTINQGIV